MVLEEDLDMTLGEHVPVLIGGIWYGNPVTQSEGFKDENKIKQYSQHRSLNASPSRSFPAAVLSLTAQQFILHYPDGRKVRIYIIIFLKRKDWNVILLIKSFKYSYNRE
jgi:hypothetical protein